MAMKSPFVFWKETRAEVAKVAWPTRRETAMTTAMIVAMALTTGLFFFAVDSLIGFSIGKILGLGS